MIGHYRTLADDLRDDPRPTDRTEHVHFHEHGADGRHAHSHRHGDRNAAHAHGHLDAARHEADASPRSKG